MVKKENGLVVWIAVATFILTFLNALYPSQLVVLGDLLLVFVSGNWFVLIIFLGVVINSILHFRFYKKVKGKEKDDRPRQSNDHHQE